MDEERIINTLKLCDEIYNSVIEEYRRLFGFAEEFVKLMHREERQLPYHMNVIDELHINENAHSRILLKLLQCKNENGEFEFLDSILRYVKDKNRISQFSNIQIKKPTITQEEARIDLWVRDKKTGYSIIFENKVYNAQDRDSQISRYIDKTIEQKFDIKNIFVLYLSSMGKEPDDQSWGKYKEEFKDRYINLSFRDDIIPWLKKFVLPNIRYKDVYLYTAIMQYIDYLEGHFRLRTINKQMNMKLETLIISHFELDKFNDTIDKVEALNEKRKDFDEVIKTMNSLYCNLCNRLFNEWKQKVQELYPEFVYETPWNWNDKVSVRFYLKEKPFIVRINSTNSKLYCQVQFEDGSEVNNTPLMTLNDMLRSSDKECTCIWEYCDYDDYRQVFDIFCKVVERCKGFASPSPEKC